VTAAADTSAAAGGSLVGRIVHDLTAIAGLLCREGGNGAAGALSLVAASAGLHALVVYVLAADAAKIVTAGLDRGDVATFLVVLSLFAVTLLVSARRIDGVIETVANRLTERLARRVIAIEPADLPSVGPDGILTGVARDLTALSGALPVAIGALRSLSFLAASLVFLAAASPLMALFAVALTAVLLRINRRAVTDFSRSDALSDAAEARFLALSRQAVGGARELALDRAKAEALVRGHLVPAARAAAQARIAYGTGMTRSLAEWRTLWFALVGAAAFGLPAVEGVGTVSLVIVILVFARVPLNDLNFQLESLATARSALAALSALEKRLPEPADPAAPPARPQAGFRRLTMRGVTYAHRDEHGRPTFTLGPIDLDVSAGEIVILSGNNGSGKSTLLAILCGLLAPDEGRIEIDGVEPDLAGLRAHFSAVLMDMPLFETLHGPDEPDANAVDALLGVLELSHKVGLDGRRFTTTALSAGERRRLALVSAVCDRRPILVLDEWTAEQSPQFRRRFFEQLLPDLRAQGRTIVAVTHERPPLSLAGRHLVLRNGRLKHGAS